MKSEPPHVGCYDFMNEKCPQMICGHFDYPKLPGYCCGDASGGGGPPPGPRGWGGGWSFPSSISFRTAACSLSSSLPSLLTSYFSRISLGGGPWGPPGPPGPPKPPGPPGPGRWPINSS